jgi:hypothetical protein
MGISINELLDQMEELKESIDYFLNITELDQHEKDQLEAKSKDLLACLNGIKILLKINARNQK